MSAANQTPVLTIRTSENPDEDIDVLNFAGTLPPASDTKKRNALVRAIRNRQLQLNEDAAYAVARAVADPTYASAVVKNDLLTTEVIGRANVSLVTAPIWLTEAFILMQPRAGGAPHSVKPPAVRGELDEEGQPLAELNVEFDDEAHLHSFIVETVTLTRRYGSDYSSSILAKRVSRPGLAHVVRLSFRDETAPFYVLCVRDGITRVVSSWAALNPGLSDYDLGVRVADRLLTSKPVSAANATETMRRSRGRESVANSLRGRFVAGAGGVADPDSVDVGEVEEGESEDIALSFDNVSEEAIRIGQTFTLPMQICVDLGERGRRAVSPDLVFDDTMQAVIASVHGEFKGWDPSATQATAVQRAIPRAVAAGPLDQGWADVALGQMDLGDVVAFAQHGVPPTDLLRGVYLMSVFTNTPEFEAVKRQLRELGIAKSFTRRKYVSHLTGLIDQPWRRKKAHTSKQAWRAWANGGPVPTSAWNSGWDPIPTDDYLTLVDAALADEVNAKMTLGVAGGIALIADKLLLANVGSALTSGQVPFRANVDVVVTGLTGSEYGLCLLAHAANAFRADGIARNSYTAHELASRPALAEGTYVVPKPDEDNFRNVARDSRRTIIPLTIAEVVYASDPTRADREQEEDEASVEEAPVERASRLRKHLIADLTRASDLASELEAAAKGDGAIVGGPIGDKKTRARLDELIRGMQSFWFKYEGQAHDPDPDAAGADDDSPEDEADEDV